MITVENDYEPIIYEQPFSSHIYENQLELLHNYTIIILNPSIPHKQHKKLTKSTLQINPMKMTKQNA